MGDVEAYVPLCKMRMKSDRERKKFQREDRKNKKRECVKNTCKREKVLWRDDYRQLTRLKNLRPYKKRTNSESIGEKKFK